MNRQHYELLISRRLLSGMLPALLATVLLVFSSCSDDELVSATDSKTMPFSSYSTTVRPGEDFYEYCLGPWMDSVGYDTGTTLQAVALNEQRKLDIIDNNAYVSYFYNLSRNYLSEDGKKASYEYLRKWLDRIETTTTKDSAMLMLYDVFNKTLQSPLLYVSSTIDYNGVVLPNVEPTTTADDLEAWLASNEGKEALKVVKVLHDGGKIIFAKGTRAATAKQPLANIASLRSPGKREPRKLPVKLKDIDRPKAKKLTQPATRATTEKGSMLSLMVHGHEYTTTYSSYREYQEKMQAISSLDSYVSSLGADSLLAIGLGFISRDFKAMTTPYNELSEELQELMWGQLQIVTWLEDMMCVRDYYRKYTSDETRRNVTDMAERLRKTYRKRIANSSWLSGAAKTYAQQKLDSMRFHILNAEPLPSVLDYEPSANSPIELIYDHMGQVNEWTSEHLWGKRLRDVFVEYLAVSEPEALMACNAYYEPYANAITILPAFALKPFYDNTQTDAMLYGITGMIVSHEMTHGFDSNGATYSMTGGAEDWWTMDDKLKYLSMQQGLINCYDNIYIGYGHYQDGTKTLDENIADCGGMSITFDAYTDLLREQGYTDETLKEQQRKMLRCYAQLWALKYSEPYLLEKLNADVHSNYRARVNGPLMNLDAFYGLYDVKSTDKMYLSPDNRSKIW